MGGYFGIGVLNGKCEENIGTLWRTAQVFGANFIFTIGRRYPRRQRTDTMKTPNHIPLFEYLTVEDFMQNIPRGCKVVAVELDGAAKPIKNFVHPKQAVYILGAEDHGIPQEKIRRCDSIIKLPGERSINVAVAGSIVLFDRINKFDNTSNHLTNEALLEMGALS